MFARLTQPDGSLPISNPLIQAMGISSGLRGCKHGTARPDLVLLDDLQTSEDAENPQTVAKLYDMIRKDVCNLAAKGKMQIICTATPIEPEDLTEKLSADKSWKTTRFQAVLRWPRDIVDNGDKGLWGEYFSLYDSELATDSPHEESLRFYAEKHRKEMDEGADVFDPNNYRREDGYISGL